VPTLKFFLSVVLVGYLVNLLIVLGKFAYHWCRALWSKSVWFNMGLSGPESEGDNLYYRVTIVPLFYDEPKRLFTFSFGLRGFQFYFIPVERITKILISELSNLQSWQVLFDSAWVNQPGRIPVIRFNFSGSARVGTGFSPGTDVIFFMENEVDNEHLDRFTNESYKNLVTHVCTIFSPPALIVKTGNTWSIGYKDPEIGRRIITRLFEEVGKKVLDKNRLDGDVRISSSDGADRFIARGQMRWWMKGSLRDDSIVIEGDGLRPGELTSADWALVTIPIEKAGDDVGD